jgi:hypothetical protein
VPWRAWHVDHDWTAPVAPLRGLKVHALFGDVEARAGGMTVVAGSHHVVARLVVADPSLAGDPPARIRRRVMTGHPYLRELGRDPGCDPGVHAARIARFMGGDEDVLGHPCQVVELTGSAGDLVLIHPLLLHTRPTNAGAAPRFLLNKDLYPAAVSLRAAG